MRQLGFCVADSLFRLEAYSLCHQTPKRWSRQLQRITDEPNAALIILVERRAVPFRNIKNRNVDNSYAKLFSFIKKPRGASAFA